MKDRLKESEAEAVDLRREVDVLRAKAESAKAGGRAPKKRKKASNQFPLEGWWDADVVSARRGHRACIS